MAIDNFRRVDFTLDKANGYIPSDQFAKENDNNGRELTVQITDGGVVKDQSSLVLTLAWKHDTAGNEGQTLFTRLNGGQGIFTVAYDNAMMIPGTVTACIQIVDGSRLTNTRNFKLRIEDNPLNVDKAVAEDSFTVFVEALAGLNKYDGRISALETGKAELEAARGGFNTLGDREDSQDSGLLATNAVVAKKADDSKLTDWMKSITIMPEYVASLEALKSKYPSGHAGLFFSMADSHKYYWDNGWVDGGTYTPTDTPKYSLNPLSVGSKTLDLKYDRVNHIVTIAVPHLEFSYQNKTFVANEVNLSHSVMGTNSDYVVLYLIFDTSDSTIKIIDNRDITTLPSTAFIVQKYNIFDRTASNNLPVLMDGKTPVNTIKPTVQRISSINLIGDVAKTDNTIALTIAKTGTLITNTGNYTITAGVSTLDVSDGSDYVYVYMRPTTVGNGAIRLVSNSTLVSVAETDVLLGNFSIGLKKSDMLFPIRFSGQLEFDAAILNGRQFNVVAAEPFIVNFEKRIIKLPKYFALKTQGYYVEGGGQNVPFAEKTLESHDGDNFDLQTLWYDALAYKLVCNPTNSQLDRRPRSIKIGDIDTVRETANFLSETQIVNAGTNAVFPVDLTPKPFFRNRYDQVAQRVKSRENAGTITLSVITDSHYCKGYNYNGLDYTDIFARNYAHLVNQNEVDKLVNPLYKVHMGDIAQGFTNKPDQMSDLNVSAGIFFDTKQPAFMIAGNHDWNIGALKNGVTNAQLSRWDVYSRINKPSEKFGIRQTVNKDHGAYTYTDDGNKLVSFFLNCYDNVDGQNADGSPIVDSFGKIGFSGEQVQFIADELAKVPDGYNVIAYTHASLEGVMEIGSGWTYNGDLVRKLFEAFNDSSTLNGKTENPIPAGLEDYYDVTVAADFTGKPAKRIITIINGHWHIDNSQVVNGILYVESLCSLEDADSSKVARPLNKYEEDAFDYLTIDRTAKKLYFTRFGAGKDREFDY